MYTSSDLRKGLRIEIDGDPYVVIQYEFLKPGKGKAYYKCKLKNLLTGSQFDKTFRASDKFEEPHLEDHDMEYLYADMDQYCFMDNTTYEQIFLTKDQVGEAINFLIENTKCKVLFFKGNPIEISLPIFVNLRIEKAEPWARGDTASGSTKPATLETGYIIQVPPFIEEGELVRIDTRTGEYVERVKE